jgi:hypothetical protein
MCLTADRGSDTSLPGTPPGPVRPLIGASGSDLRKSFARASNGDSILADFGQGVFQQPRLTVDDQSIMKPEAGYWLQFLFFPPCVQCREILFGCL